MKLIQFNNYEKSGIIFFMSVLIIVIYMESHSHKQSRKTTSFDLDTLEIVQSIKFKGKAESDKNPSPGKNKSQVKAKKNLENITDFNPNTISRFALTEMGLEPKVIDNLMKYRDKGGKFYKKEDLKKIYGLTNDQFMQLKPYINIPSKSSNGKIVLQDTIEEMGRHGPEIKKIKIIDINEATTEEWESLPGIGKILSERIIRYKQALGGFRSIDQIREVYGIKSEVYDNFETSLQLKQDSINQLSINKISFKELLKHPYADYELTRSIINYREINGQYSSREDLYKLYLTDSAQINRLLPYLKFDQF